MEIVLRLTIFADVEKLLTGLGAIKYGDSRLTKRHLDEDEPKQTGIRQGNRTTVEDDDSDAETVYFMSS